MYVNHETAQHHLSMCVCSLLIQTVVCCSQAWSQLGKMSSVEAMRLYVRTLDEEQVRCRAQLAPPALHVFGPRQTDRLLPPDKAQPALMAWANSVHCWPLLAGRLGESLSDLGVCLQDECTMFVRLARMGKWVSSAHSPAWY